MGERIDSINSYFVSVKLFNRISIFLFWLSIAISFAVLFLSGYPLLKSWTNVIFILVTLLYFTCSNFLALYLTRKSENKRRTHLLSNSFDIPLDDEETNKYYNNNEIPSIRKFGINVFENSLFTSKTTNRMLIMETLKIFIYIIIWIFLMLNRNTSLDLLTIVGQTLFSTSIITNWIRLLILKIET